MRSIAFRLWILLVLSLGTTAVGRAAEERLLVPLDRDADLSGIRTTDATVQTAAGERGPALRVATGHAQKWPGIAIEPAEPWNLDAFQYVAVDVTNAGTKPARVGLRVDPAGGSGEVFLQQVETIDPGQTRALQTTLTCKMPPRVKAKLFGMRGYPDQLDPDKGFQTKQIRKLTVFVSQPQADHVIEIRNLRAGGQSAGSRWLTDDLDRLFPMIDRFGQYRHADWPGKTASEDDLRRRVSEEQADLSRHPGPQDWNEYGGWLRGPQAEATGRFRVEKRQEQWWLVDPAGRLFWSQGVDCVRDNNATTPIEDREFYFAELPERVEPWARFYGRSSFAPHGYYQGKGSYQTFNFTGLNLFRKYGDTWREQYSDLCHRRLRSWGLNTIGNWSDPEIYRRQKTPYVVTANSGRRPIEGSSGYWGKFPDPFDPDFAARTLAGVRAQAEAACSAWCLGVFVDNELAWGEELSLAVATLASPASQPAKGVFLDDLRAKYDTIERLNAAWGTQHPSWESLRDAQQPPDQDKARDDLADFATRIAEKYFEVCRAAVHEAAPQTLYLGCRFAWVNDRAIRAASKYCDVIGFNKYAYSVADFRLPAGVDRPAIIGEFHFGALDRGMFHPGLRKTKDQADRAATYRDYVQGALDNPLLVGAHWFQFGDQATTGRGDGENYQIGFVDVCDTPYPELVAASREVAAAMYARRAAVPAESRPAVRP